MSTNAIVLDKCFLQGAKVVQIHKMAESHRLVVSDALFYELLTGSEPGRSRCFAKFPPIDNPVDLVSNIGTLMRIEINTHRSAGKPSTHREALRFQLNPLLLNPEYELPEEAQQEVDKKTCDLQSDVRSFVSRASTMGSFFPDLLTGSQADRTQARDDAEQAVAEPGWLSAFYTNLYSSLEPLLGERPFPPSNLLAEDWAIYRYLQVQLLFGIDLYVRYQGNVPNEISATIFEKLEHDVLDAQVLMLGCLEGAFATNENKLKHWWRLLCPDGALYE